MKLVSTRIITVDVLALARFYEKITGTAPVGTEDFVQFTTEGENLAISSKRSADLYQPGAGTPANNLSMIIEFEVDDVDQERVRLKDIVKVWVLEPTNQPWGNRSMLFRDPDGNLINFYAPITREK
jgi:uncharacterized glyoxalase superfamily protein PhnB